MGLPVDPSRSAELYLLVASKGDPAGYLNLGVSYLYGRGVVADDVMGAKYVSMAAEMVIPMCVS